MTDQKTAKAATQAADPIETPSEEGLEPAPKSDKIVTLTRGDDTIHVPEILQEALERDGYKAEEAKK